MTSNNESSKNHVTYCTFGFKSWPLPRKIRNHPKLSPVINSSLWIDPISMLKLCLSPNIDGDMADSIFQFLLGKLVFLFYFDDPEIERSLMGASISQLRLKNFKLKHIRPVVDSMGYRTYMFLWKVSRPKSRYRGPHFEFMIWSQTYSTYPDVGLI